MDRRQRTGDVGQQDLVRFNEAIDQAVAESTKSFSTQMEQMRNLFLGVLGHDMRNPLNSILMTASHLAVLNAGAEVTKAASRLTQSGASMKALLDDLTDFNRTKLGFGIDIQPARIDLAGPCADEIEQLRGAHPTRRIELKVTGDLRGCWDGSRLQQLMRNLVLNALTHGAPDAGVRVDLIGQKAEIRIDVRSADKPGSVAVSDDVFEPLMRGPATNPGSGLGLGLYIVREVARAHGGNVSLDSRDGETVFSVQLPRRDEEPAARPVSSMMAQA